MPHATGPKIAIVTDSAACIPPAFVQKYDIRIVRYQLIWDGQTYLDGQGLTHAEFYRRFRESQTYPTTAQPTLGSFVEVYAELAQEAEGIVPIHIPERLSSAIRTARIAAREVSPTPVRVIDANAAAGAQAFVALAAARAAEAGSDLEQVVSVAEECTKHVGMYAAIETLEHLRRGGRIGQAATLVGSRLRIQPVMTLIEGEVRVVGVTRSRQRAKDCILDELAQRVGESPIRASVFHADVAEEAAQLAEQVQQRFDCTEFFISEFTPVMGAHTGPGTIGVAFCLEDQQTS